MSEIKTNKISAIANANLQLNVQQTQRVLITPTGVEVTGAVKATTTITAETFNKTKPYLVSAYGSLTDINETGTVVCNIELIDTQGIYNPSTGLMTSPFTTS